MGEDTTITRLYFILVYFHPVVLFPLKRLQSLPRVSLLYSPVASYSLPQLNTIHTTASTYSFFSTNPHFNLPKLVWRARFTLLPPPEDISPHIISPETPLAPQHPFATSPALDLCSDALFDSIYIRIMRIELLLIQGASLHLT